MQNNLASGQTSNCTAVWAGPQAGVKLCATDALQRRMALVECSSIIMQAVPPGWDALNEPKPAPLRVARAAFVCCQPELPPLGGLSARCRSGETHCKTALAYVECRVPQCAA